MATLMMSVAIFEDSPFFEPPIDRFMPSSDDFEVPDLIWRHHGLHNTWPKALPLAFKYSIRGSNRLNKISLLVRSEDQNWSSHFVRNKHGPSVVQSMVPENELRAFKLIRARHETVNGRFKEWKILSNCYRHHESCHASVFHAMATITQIEIADGSRPVFSIGNLQLC